MSTSNLQILFQSLKNAHPNGELVAKRQAQLLDFSLQPENEHLIPSVAQVLRVIESREINLIENDSVKSNRRLLHEFREAMYASSDDEWDTFKRDINLEPMKGEGSARLLADASGLVRSTGFEAWVLGRETKPIDPETIPDKVKIC